jgi:hypothetical protein
MVMTTQARPVLLKTLGQPFLILHVDILALRPGITMTRRVSPV